MSEELYMGLDGVELVVEAEDRFGIDLSREDLSSVRTVGDFAATIQRSLGIAPVPWAAACRDVCILSRAFHQLRSAWAGDGSLGGVRLRPSTKISAFTRGIPGWLRRRRLWSVAGKAGIDLPELHPPGGFDAVALVGVVAAGLAALVLTHWSGLYYLPILILSAAAWLAVGAQKLVTASMPAGIVTIADAIRACPQDRLKQWEIREPNDLEMEVIRLVAAQLGHEPTTVKLDSRLVEDLGMD